MIIITYRILLGELLSQSPSISPPVLTMGASPQIPLLGYDCMVTEVDPHNQGLIDSFGEESMQLTIVGQYSQPELR